jgi:alkylation response protein AidB-like acyl-CoA dehydrogenase
LIEDIAATVEERVLAEAARKSIAACASLAPDAVPARLGEDGLIGLLAPEDAGGLGLGLSAAWPVLQQAGSALLAAPLAEAMLAAACIARTQPQIAARLIAGEESATIAWGAQVEALAADSGFRLTGLASRAPGAAAADWLLVPTAAGPMLFARSGPGVTLLETAQLDIERPYADLRLEAVSGLRLEDAAAVTWLCKAGAILRAADMLGAAEASFSEACAHASTRRQFGKPLSGQQVVATELARSYYRLECVRTSIAYAAQAHDRAQEDADDAGDIAAALAADELALVAENAIQVHGAMGFTWDLPLHRRLRRIRAAGDIASGLQARAALATRLLTRWQEAA